jgi:hypothetical protein
MLVLRSTRASGSRRNQVKTLLTYIGCHLRTNSINMTLDSFREVFSSELRFRSVSQVIVAHSNLYPCTQSIAIISIILR